MRQLGDRVDPPLSQLDDLPRLQPAEQGNIVGADRALPTAPFELAGRTVAARQEFRRFRCREQRPDLVRRRARIARFDDLLYAVIRRRGLGEKIGLYLAPEERLTDVTCDRHHGILAQPFESKNTGPRRAGRRFFMLWRRAVAGTPNAGTPTRRPLSGLRIEQRPLR